MSAESPIHALLVEDDLRLARLTQQYLQQHRLSVTIAEDGVSGLALCAQQSFDVVLLDLMLPDLDGLEVCRELRTRSDVPVIMLTARTEEADRVLGLESGADDYLPKPFSSRELLARIRAVVRRARGRVGPARAGLTAGALSLDPGARAAHHDGRLLELTSYEFDLLYALVERSGRVLTRDQLMTLAGGNVEEAFDRSIDVHISRLRQKLGDNPKKPTLIRTVRGVGYQYLTQPTP